MSDFTLLLPFGLPPSELAPDLLRALELPALSMLLARAEPVAQNRPAPGSRNAARTDHDDGFARALPHETWLAQRFGLEVSSGGSPAVATALMAAHTVAPPEGQWFVLTPVHFHVARDHLVLTDSRGLSLSETEAMDLFTAALPSFEEAGLTLRYGGADCWFVRADDWRDLVTATPDATCGHNIDIWMPQGASARAWRKLQNSVQMDWHAHPVNLARAGNGLQPVNSLWLWGGADAAHLPPAQADLAVAGLRGWSTAFEALATGDRPTADLPALLATSAPNKLLLQDQLIAPALAGDWAHWLDAMRAIETDCFAPLLAALRDGRIDRLQLILNHATALHAWSLRRAALRKFWRTPSLARLRTESAASEAAA